MARLFVAIPFSDEAQARFLAMQPPASAGVRLSKREELHVTLQFLGEVADDHHVLVRNTLATVKVSPFTITLRGLGQFPPEGAPQVLWSRVEPSPFLSALHHAIGAALTDAIGFRPESRPYTPHVTLAYVKESLAPDQWEAYLRTHDAVPTFSVLVNRFALYSSTRMEDGPQYQVQAEFDLSETA